MSSARAAAEKAYTDGIAAGLTEEEAWANAGKAFERVFRRRQRKRMEQQRRRMGHAV